MKKVDLIVTAPHIYTMKGEGVGYEEKKALVVRRKQDHRHRRH